MIGMGGGGFEIDDLKFKPSHDMRFAGQFQDERDALCGWVANRGGDPICAGLYGRYNKIGIARLLQFSPGVARRTSVVDYRHVEKLFDMLAEYFHNKPPPEEHDGRGEWIRVRDGLQGAEHCIRVLTPEEFEEWHRAIETPIQVEFGRRPVAFCSHEGQWWVIYDDSEENEVIRQFEKCFEGPEDNAAPADFVVDEQLPISGFFGMRVLLERHGSPPARFRVAYDSARAEFSISPVRLLQGYLPPRALSLVTEWASQHEKELLAAWQEQAAGREPGTIKPLA
jgi:hypothetical protein